ncbi:hypothetical protein ACFV1F_31845 [Streptomyces sp. NPDC059590]|uniref:hypothetical protein n=1 Tax=Streptomyces sp. NPDC059590 TaxID=3346877 RepID=UPI00369CBF21
MSRQRDAVRIPGGTVRATVPSVLRRAVLLCTIAFWLAPSFLHPAAEHTSAVRHASVSAHPPSGPESRPATAPVAAPGRACPDPASLGPPTGTHSAGGAGDNCVAGPRGVSQGLVPAPVPPPALADFPPRERPHDTDATRAPPDRAIRAPGLHQLQVLRT